MSGASTELLVCSHRGPFVHERVGDELVANRGGGGLIGAIAPVLSAHGGTWIAAAMSDGDRELARQQPAGKDEGGFHVRLLDLPRDEHALHYDVVSNQYLWFLFHYLFDVANTPVFDASFSRAWEAYKQINELYVTAVQESEDRADAILVQDYHLMLVGSLLRERRRSRRPLLYFHHTPWCDPAYFAMLPENIAKDLLEAVLSYDVVGFHARRWADAFTECCERLLPKAKVSADGVEWKRRSSAIVVAPVPLDSDELSRAAGDAQTREWVSRHEDMRAGRKLLLRVDRIDLSKNPLRGFLAFEELLERRSSLASEVVFLALLYPSRLTVASYRRYFTECLRVVRRVNERHAGAGAPDGPIELHFEDQYRRSLGAMRCCDALLVNPVFDGLNLVAKEGAFVNERSASLLLSRNAGAYEELGSAALGIDPFDVSGTADAIEQAVDLPMAKRERTALSLRRLAAASSPTEWVAAQLRAAGVDFT